VPVTATDADNNVTTQYNTYDNLGRPLMVTQNGPGLSRTATTTYDDVDLKIATTQSDTANSSLTSETDYDPMGRVRLTVDGAGNHMASASRYGSGNRLQLQSKPYTGNAPPGWTLTTMDTVGRVIEVDHYSGSAPPAPWGSNTTKTGTATFGYDLTLSGCTGPAAGATDEAGNTKYTCSDGLGRLISVTEPDPASGAPGTVTTYGYDSLNNLTSVDMSGQPTLSCGHMRCFTYSTLSRLISATNPESGTTTYTYDNNGNLRTRTDANGTTMTVAGYDGLNRPTGSPAISYSVGGQTAATNSVTYAYDHDFKGSLWSVSNTASATSYTHDGFGRITGSTQTTGAYPPFNFTYGYSLTDTLTSITYPSTRQVNYTLDAGDRVTAVNLNGGGTYASSISYTASGGLSALTLGNAITETYTWNDRFQPTGMTAKQGSTTLLGLGFYPCPTNGTACASSDGTGNNGNLLSQTITMPGLSQLTQSYSYDHLNRLTGAQEVGGGANWSQTYGYDTVGNRWVPTSSGLPALPTDTPLSQSWYSTTVPNRIASWTYDGNGNVLQEGSVARSFTYDAENRQVTACLNCAPGPPTATYMYDGEGQRVSKTVSGQTTTYVYDAFGNLAAEYGGDSSACGTCYVTTDHLGSTRLLTNAGGVFARYDYEPFGQEIGANYDGRTTPMGFTAMLDDANPKFTGQMRDYETTLDWFNVRYYSGWQGRFQSPDPGNAGADPSNPQSWNGYAYVANNPLSYTDPTGMFVEDPYCADPVSCGIAAAVAAFDLGELLADIFGGGPPSSIPSSLATPSSPIMGPTFSVTGWGTADTVAPSWSAIDGMIPVVIPGLTFYAQGTGQAGRSGAPSQNSSPCTLTTPGGKYTLGPNAVAHFQLPMASALSNAFNNLNSEGITPQITSGFRSPADQMRMRNGASGPNPAAVVSWHEVGMAVDINGTASSYFSKIISAMKGQGLTWGGNFSHRDPPHFQLPRAGTRPPAAMVSACGGG
jgi:RHS repeat-associated protein